MIALYCAVEAYLLTVRLRSRTDLGREGGQATAEYALVLLAAATVALILLAWATKTGKIGELFDKVIDSLIGKVT